MAKEDLEKGAKIYVSDLGYISDESDFCGNEETKQALEERVKDFDIRQIRAQHPTLDEIAKANLKKKEEGKKRERLLDAWRQRFSEDKTCDLYEVDKEARAKRLNEEKKAKKDNEAKKNAK